MIAVTFALPAESNDLRRHLRAQPMGVSIFHTGVGVAACRERLPAFLDSQNPTLLISSGFAGGIRDSLGAGDLFLANNFSDPPLLARAVKFLPARVGNLASSDAVLESEAQRNAFAGQTGAEAVDMETAVIAEACNSRRIPLLALRVISDTAAAPFPAPPAILFDLERQRTRSLAIVGYLLRHPQSWPRFLRFSRQVARARSNLTQALLILLRELQF